MNVNDKTGNAILGVTVELQALELMRLRTVLHTLKLSEEPASHKPGKANIELERKSSLRWDARSTFSKIGHMSSNSHLKGQYVSADELNESLELILGFINKITDGFGTMLNLDEDLTKINK